MKALQRQFLFDLMRLRARAPEERAALFRAPPKGTVEARWRVYSCGYIARIAEALRGEYRAIDRILGSAVFDALIARYVVFFPPRTHDLGDAGDRLAQYLECDPLAEEFPFLPDLARLERAIAMAFIAADAEVLDWEDACALAPAAVAALPLATAPGVALLRSDWPLEELWRCHARADDEIDIDLAPRARGVVVYRHGWRVRIRTLAADALHLLDQVMRGGANLLHLQARAPWNDGAAGALRLTGALRDLVSLGLFVMPQAAANPARLRPCGGARADACAIVNHRTAPDRPAPQDQRRVS